MMLPEIYQPMCKAPTPGRFQRPQDEAVSVDFVEPTFLLDQVPRVVAHEEVENDIRLETPPQMCVARGARCGAKAADPEVENLHGLTGKTIPQGSLQALRQHAILGNLQCFGEGIPEERKALDFLRFRQLSLSVAHTEAIEVHGNAKLASGIDEVRTGNGFIVRVG
jgi:hypothetical protein